MLKEIQCSIIADYETGFGNQLFLIAACCNLAERYGVEVQVPKNWIGWRLFDLPPYVTYLKSPVQITESELYFRSLESLPERINIKGNFQDSLTGASYSREFARNLIKFKKAWEAIFKDSSSYLAVHIRRGDFRHYQNVFYMPTDDCISREIQKIRFQIPEGIPVRFLYDVSTYRALEDTDRAVYPRWVHQVESSLTPDLTFLPDFFCMMNSTYLMRAPSTFSYWAGLLHRGKKVFSPDIHPNNLPEETSDLQTPTPFGPCDVSYREGNRGRLSAAYFPLPF